jgi:peptide/nickel transport system permease protein
MSILRQAAWAVLLIVFAGAAMAGWISPASYETQFRDNTSARASRQFPLGTDELGRDRLSRLLYGGRVSLLLAPAAAFLAILLGTLAGGIAGYFGSLTDRIVMAAADLFLSLPWLFLLLMVRAMLPLNASPWTSAIITFLLLGGLGWAAPARVIRAAVRDLHDADFLLQARAQGCSNARLLRVHLLPNLRPVLSAQFLLLIPSFILSEASLGLLGLGVSEPLPSWGNMLRGLENYHAVRVNPMLAAPALLLIIVTVCFQIALSREAITQ